MVAEVTASIVGGTTSGPLTGFSAGRSEPSPSLQTSRGRISGVILRIHRLTKQLALGPEIRLRTVLVCL